MGIISLMLHLTMDVKAEILPSKTNGLSLDTATSNLINVYMRYQTCAMQGQNLIKYADIYHLNQQKEKELHHTSNDSF
jgi:hypothetical protein